MRPLNVQLRMDELWLYCGKATKSDGASYAIFVCWQERYGRVIILEPFGSCPVSCHMLVPVYTRQCIYWRLNLCRYSRQRFNWDIKKRASADWNNSMQVTLNAKKETCIIQVAGSLPPGIEPGSQAWQACILTTILRKMNSLMTAVAGLLEASPLDYTKSP